MFSKLNLLVVLLSCGCCLPGRAGDDYDPHAFLRGLLQRSDLVVVATPQTVSGGCMSEGPLTNGVTPTPEFDGFIPQLKVNQVIKGDISTDKLLLINYTVMNVGPKDPPKPITGKFSFKIDPDAKPDEVGYPGSPRKGVAYVFFLENRKLREPGSYSAAGKAEIFYRNFDYWFGMVPASAALIFELKELARAK